MTQDISIPRSPRDSRMKTSELAKMTMELIEAEQKVHAIRSEIQSQLTQELLQHGDTSYFSVDWKKLRTLALRY